MPNTHMIGAEVSQRGRAATKVWFRVASALSRAGCSAAICLNVKMETP